MIYIIFLIAIIAPLYTYLIYPLILKILKPKNYIQDGNFQPTVSIVIAAYNEEKVIQSKIENIIRLDYPKDKIEYIIGSDGSTDKTNEILKQYSDVKNIHILYLPRKGKVAVINEMLKIVKGEIIIFSDANTLFSTGAIKNLVKHFVDTKIGCVSGQLRYKVDINSGEGAELENIYWKYENWIKIQESKVGCLSGANGAIYSIRKGLVNKIKDDIINDDFYISTTILLNGYKVIMDKDAIAYEDPNDSIESQFKRHIRDGAGHYQAIIVFWKLLLPRNGSFIYISHRLIRWLIPFLLIVAIFCNMLLVSQNWVMFVLFILQIVFYIVIIFNYVFIYTKKKVQTNKILKLLSLITYFMLLNLALIIGCYKLIAKKQKAFWETQR